MKNRNGRDATLDDLLWLGSSAPPVVYIPGYGYMDARLVQVVDVIDAIDDYLAADRAAAVLDGPPS